MPARHTLRNLLRCGALIAAFTSEKTMNDDQKKFIPQLVVDTEFFSAHLPILVRCKTKGAVGTVFALLRNWQLNA
jgi:hypothetical protein